MRRCGAGAREFVMPNIYDNIEECAMTSWAFGWGRRYVELCRDTSVDAAVDLVGADPVQNAVLAECGTHGGLQAGQAERDA